MQWYRSTVNIRGPEPSSKQMFQGCFHKFVNRLKIGTKEPEVMRILNTQLLQNIGPPTQVIAQAPWASGTAIGSMPLAICGCLHSG